ncbi:thioredoxin family protein [Candidatus Pacearchaeota archaeon CG10_big_fil_rev_8_21_14_0_10_35_219]|nr:thioredoxin family protein [Candidatus Pacearchaeota archaeon]OIO43309.1 MAG: thioredoxin family protein [Candidatus Pacearchaeota archaeon CG1_02_35_32]PIO07761.1 MAG: thioredoxin family protein [Candidatus Pacearchaeota archaeon CG10_big_fil_rev_8_21_14_0_10_35_219]PIY81457.1 MAG: thioredoxin family protein [Candidatus Pacearchaeota archaeon CG_4_10_14_0_8_um_filter_35_169]PIZ80457.1 MAG: thioredoxin family protein [Candidatus Pacearchaeota archaeon CG_4_10_14_0_2_um_filter_35_33]PJA69632
MVLLKSVPIKIGTKMPDFLLRDAEDVSHHSKRLYGEKGLLVIFTCIHCPYAQAVWPRIIQIADQASELGINTVAINPNINSEFPEDSPEAMKTFIKENILKFPFLQDSSQNTAKKYQAQCTPDIYLMDSNRKLVYHGRIDDNWQHPDKVTKHELLEAINNLANDFPAIPEEDQEPSIGCSIKWLDNQEPVDDLDKHVK